MVSHVLLGVWKSVKLLIIIIITLMGRKQEKGKD